MKKWAATSLPDALAPAVEAQKRLGADEFIDSLIQLACPNGLPLGEVHVWDESAPVSRRDALRELLAVMAAKYYLSQDAKNKPTSKQASAQLRKISEASKKLIAAICPDGGEPSTWLQQKLLLEAGGNSKVVGVSYPKLSIKLLGGIPIYPDDDYLSALIQTLTNLRNWSKSAASSVAEGTRIGTAEHSLTAAFKVIIYAWSRVLDRPVKTSTTSDTGEASGPLVQFIGLCLEKLEPGLMTNESIRDRVRRMFMDKAES